MRVGVPTEVKNHEYRVAITPSGVHELFTSHPGLYRKHGQNRQRSHADSLITQRRECEHTQYDVCSERKCQSLRHNSHNFRSLTKRARDFGCGLPLVSLGDSLVPASASTWCTGKDSNLRTSLGGTDLQSVGFNHSPTCATSALSF